MINLIQSIINEPIASIGLSMLLFFIFLIGYLTAWCFKGGIIRFLFGLLLITDAFINLLNDGSIMVDIAFWGGFIYRFFDGWQGIIRKKDNLLWKIEKFWNSAFIRLLRRLLSEKPKQKQKSSNNQSEYQRTNNKQEEIEKERVRRAEEMHRQREAEKSSKQSKQNNSTSSRTEQSEKIEDSDQYQENKKRDNCEDDFNARIQKTIRDGYLATLGLAPDREYTQEEIKKAYRRQANKYHPDRHMGKSEAEMQVINERFSEIKRAYEWLNKDPTY